MLISEFSEEFLDLGHAQFAISIALSQLNEIVAAKAVLEYKGTNVNGVSDVSKVWKERKELEQKILSSGKDMLTGLLEVLCAPGAIAVVKKGGIHSMASKVSLKDLLSPGFNVNIIYRRAMSMLRKEHPYKLITAYMDTGEYRESFKRDVAKKYRLSADKYRGNDISDSIIEEIRRNFREFVYYNSASGVYDPATGTPIAFLRNTFNSFYDVGPDNRVQKVFNTRGTNSNVGGEDSNLTAIDFVGLESKKDEPELDFIDVASRIQKASFLLFSHSNSKIAFLDILSCYRDNMIKNRIDSEKLQYANMLCGCDIRFVDSMNDLSGGNIDTVRNKKNSRVNLCKLFSPIVDNGVAQKDLYTYYEKAINYTKNLTTTKDATHLFRVEGANTKHRENNSQMFQIIVSGHLALRELIEYLKKDNTVASVYNFPPIIFRDESYLKRFQTIEEYVNYVSDVSKLVNEVSNDSDRLVEKKDGFVLNDEMWGYLGVSNLMHDGIFRKLASMPLGYITSAVNDSMTLSKDKVFEKKFRNMDIQCNAVMSKYNEYLCTEKTIAPLYKQLQLVFSLLRDPRMKGQSEHFQYAIALSYYSNLVAALNAEYKPVCDENGYYQYTYDSVAEELAHPSDSCNNALHNNETFLKLYKQQIAQRSWAIQYLYEFFTGETIDDVCDWKQIREFFCIGELLLVLLKRLHSRIRDVRSDVCAYEGNMYLTIASMAKDNEIFNLPQTVVSCDDLTFLYTENVSEFYINNIKSTDECFEINEHRNRKLIAAVNKFLGIFGEDYEAFKLSTDLLEKFVAKKYTPVVVETKIDKILHKAASALKTYINSFKVDAAIRTALRGIAPSDEDGYVLIHGERCDLYNDDSYVLNNGFIVRLTPDYMNYSYNIMTIDDLERLRRRVDFNNCIYKN